ncbi:MAG: hypothetical protein Kow0098_02790 [Ignavibacteriaceae bacterium]
MREFRYPVLIKWIYRYGNIPVTIIFSLYLLYFAVGIDRNQLFLIPFGITILLIYFLNKYYLNLYKIIPYRIIADEEKIVCDAFLFSDKKITIKFSDIVSLSGGIFEGKLSGVMKVCDGQNNACIGFFHRINDAKILETLLLSKVNRDIYNSVIDKIKAKQKGS